MWTYILFLALNDSPQYLQLYTKAPGKWRFSTCLVALLRSLLILEQSVQRTARGPNSGTFSRYSLIVRLASRTGICQSHNRNLPSSPVHGVLVHWKTVHSVEFFAASLTFVHELSWEVNAFHVFPQITPLTAGFPTQSANKQARLFLYIPIQGGRIAVCWK